MKSKNLFLGLFAFVFAIGSAFASLSFVPTPVAINEDLEGGSTGIECVNVNAQCNTAATSITCEIEVFDVSLNSTKNVPAYQRGTMCSTELKQDAVIVPTNQIRVE